MDLTKHIAKAKGSSFGLWKLNWILQAGIPFNKPHNIRIIEIGDTSVKIRIPYKRKNLNHIKGIHACGLATACEYASGFVLLNRLGSKKYRIIMESIDVKYFYQAKMAAIASYSISEEELEKQLFGPLQTEEKVYIRCEIKCHDTEGNHVCTGYTNWQVKSWDKVKTKM